MVVNAVLLLANALACRVVHPQFSRHPEVRSLVLLAGGTDSAGVKYLEDNS